MRCPLARIVHPLNESQLARVEPGDRLVVLARTIQVRDPGTEAVLKDSAVNWAHLGETCLGQALYLHRTIFKNASEAPVWSHLELSYFRSMISSDAIQQLVIERQPATMDLLRAEILLTTPSSFTAPRLARLGRSARTPSITGVYPSRTSILQRVPERHAGLLWTCRRQACPSGQIWNVQGDGNGGGALSRPEAGDRLEPDSPVRAGCRRLSRVWPGV